MGKDSQFGFRNVFIGLLSIAISLIYRLLPTQVEPYTWSEYQLATVPRLEGPFQPNEDLQRVEHLYVGDLVGPECFAEDEDGFVYTGLLDGRIVRFDSHGNNAEEVFFVGGYFSGESQEMDGTDVVDLKVYCHNEIRDEGFTNPERGQRCGRPLGLRMKGRRLFVADCYFGVFALEFGLGREVTSVTLYFDARARIPSALMKTENYDPSVMKKLKFVNDLDITSDMRYMFFTDSSWKYSTANWMYEINDGAPRGRLIRLDMRNGKAEVVSCGLHFPNGVQITPDEKAVLVSETARFRVLAYNMTDLIRGSEAVQRDIESCEDSAALPPTARIFVDNLPGMPDNLRLSQRGEDRYLLGLPGKSTAPFPLLHILYKFPWLRNLMGKLVPMKMYHKWVRRYGLYVELDLDGKVLRSFHDPTGRTAYISDAHYNSKSNYTFLGSPRNAYVGRLSP